MTNKQLTWVLAAAIGGGLLVLMTVLELGVKSTANSTANISLECIGRSDQCEAIADTRPMAEPQNTISNLAYLVAGIAIFVRSLRAGFDRRRVPALSVGLCFCFLAVCSAYYHATLNDIPAAGRLPACNPERTSLPQYLDVVGVYLALLAIVCYGLDRLMTKRLEAGPLSALTILFSVVVGLVAWIGPGAIGEMKLWLQTGFAIWVLCGIWAAAIGTMDYFRPTAWIVWVFWGVVLVVNTVFSAKMKGGFGFDSDLVFPVLVGLLLAIAAMNIILPDRPGGLAWRASLTELLLTLAVFTIGIMVRVLDGTGHPLCSAGSVLQAHAVWHVMSALALLLTFDLIEKSSGVSPSNGSPEDRGPALLPASGTVATWLTRRGDVLGRRLPALLFNIGGSLVALGFALVMLLNFGGATVSALVPLLTAVWLWAVTYTGPGTV